MNEQRTDSQKSSAIYPSLTLSDQQNNEPSEHISDRYPSTGYRTVESSIPDKFVTKDEILHSLVRFAGNHFFVTENMVKKFKIKDVTLSCAFQYMLDTFTESREIKDSKEGYDGEELDTPEHGKPPGIWDIEQMPQTMFQYCQKKSQFPHTAGVKICGKCDGVQRIECTDCKGTFQSSCLTCKGKYRMFTTQACPVCVKKDSDKGKPSCAICRGKGMVVCENCKGRGKVKLFKQLITTWRNHYDEHFLNETPLPNKYARNAKRHIAIQETSARVSPLDNFPCKAINETSRILIDKHKEFPSERIIQQKHQVLEIPIVEVKYSWESNVGRFFIYGMEKEVYFPEYKKLAMCGLLSLVLSN